MFNIYYKVYILVNKKNFFYFSIFSDILDFN